MQPLRLDVEKPLDETRELLEKQLNENGFGILSIINFSDILKNKLGAEIERTVILGVCNPHIAYEAVKIDSDVGLLLPCNITLKEYEDKTAIAIANPFDLLSQDNLHTIAIKAYELLSKVLENTAKLL
ncbi:MAG: DUF302 domain-containing protein [Firmicutes bacterium]|nr:DUF302 domain-containing protein [Bacillota bacterium]